MCCCLALLLAGLLDPAFRTAALVCGADDQPVPFGSAAALQSFASQLADGAA